MIPIVETPSQVPRDELRPHAQEILDLYAHMNIGLIDGDGILLVPADLFKRHLNALATSDVELCGTYKGVMKRFNEPENRRLLYIEKTRLYPSYYWRRRECQTPKREEYSRYKALGGFWHLHPIDLSPMIMDVYFDFDIVVIRRENWRRRSLVLYLISRLPFSEIWVLPPNLRLTVKHIAQRGMCNEDQLRTDIQTALGRSSNGYESQSCKHVVFTPRWARLSHPALDDIQQDRFALPEFLEIDMKTGLLRVTGRQPRQQTLPVRIW